eukprot:CAMPEP_0169274478 /NCGR_PEP_ID=MMETSP1016-20121227/51752_1 /TAXON_ID=342587 /ORGANISM="Karlodinium micrum, Strain CCMP2283" /LENGTH=89 /DNA_ID=CAMNT_0009361053 /DNA_START=559 /DNA_END=828 /DNA_ORIENTATION=-
MRLPPPLALPLELVEICDMMWLPVPTSGTAEARDARESMDCLAPESLDNIGTFSSSSFNALMNFPPLRPLSTILPVLPSFSNCHTSTKE